MESNALVQERTAGWFEGHVNWTLVIFGWLVPGALALLWGVLSQVSDWLYGLVFMLSLPYGLLWLYVWWWALSQKGRSHAWMLLGGLGFIIALLLSNKKVSNC